MSKLTDNLTVEQLDRISCAGFIAWNYSGRELDGKYAWDSQSEKHRTSWYPGTRAVLDELTLIVEGK